MPEIVLNAFHVVTYLILTTHYDETVAQRGDGI